MQCNVIDDEMSIFGNVPGEFKTFNSSIKADVQLR